MQWIYFKYLNMRHTSLWLCVCVSVWLSYPRAFFNYSLFYSLSTWGSHFSLLTSLCSLFSFHIRSYFSAHSNFIPTTALFNSLSLSRTSHSYLHHILLTVFPHLSSSFAPVFSKSSPPTSQCLCRGILRAIDRKRKEDNEMGAERSGYDWARETPRCQKFTCKNSLLPPLFSSVFTVSSPVLPVSLLHHASSPLSCASFLPFFQLCLFHYLTSPLSPPPPLSFCVTYHPALLHLHCGAALTIRTLHTYTHTRAEAHKLLIRTQGDTRPPLPAAPSLSHTSSSADTKNSNPLCTTASTRETLLILHQQYSVSSVDICLYNNCNYILKWIKYRNNNHCCPDVSRFMCISLGSASIISLTENHNVKKKIQIHHLCEIWRNDN